MTGSLPFASPHPDGFITADGLAISPELNDSDLVLGVKVINSNADVNTAEGAGRRNLRSTVDLS